MGPLHQGRKKKLPRAKIVFDQFHVVAAFGRVIDKIRNSECRKASMENKAVFKGARYLLLKNRGNVRRKKHRVQLKELLSLNEVINTVMMLKEQLKQIWRYKSRNWAVKAFDHWCALARLLIHHVLNKFVAMLERHSDGTLNQCYYPVNTGLLEEINNKIKVMKSKAYGYHDLRYFTLKIFQTYYN